MSFIPSNHSRKTTEETVESLKIEPAEHNLSTIISESNPVGESEHEYSAAIAVTETDERTDSELIPPSIDATPLASPSAASLIIHNVKIEKEAVHKPEDEHLKIASGGNIATAETQKSVKLGKKTLDEKNVSKPLVSISVRKGILKKTNEKYKAADRVPQKTIAPVPKRAVTAKKMQSPVVKHLTLENTETKTDMKEIEQEAISSKQQTAKNDLEGILKQQRAIIESKNSELESNKLELEALKDQIRYLESLRDLQLENQSKVLLKKQGKIISEEDAQKLAKQIQEQEVLIHGVFKFDIVPNGE